MADAAEVDAIELLREWHSALCVFRTEASEALAAISLEIQRTDSWLDDQLRSWQREARDAEEEVVRCKAELATRKTPDFSGRIPDCSVQETNLRRAKARLEFARDQIDVVRGWYTKMPKLIEEAYTGPGRRLSNFLEAELPRGIALLKNQIASLEAYVNLRSEPPPPAPPPKTESGESQ